MWRHRVKSPREIDQRRGVTKEKKLRDERDVRRRERIVRDMERVREVSIDQLPGFLSQGIGMGQFERMPQLRQRVASCNLASWHIAQHTAMPEPCPHQQWAPSLTAVLASSPACQLARSTNKVAEQLTRGSQGHARDWVSGRKLPKD